MRFRIEQQVSAPLEAVEAALHDPEFLTHLGTLPKLGRPELLEQREEGGRLHQRVRYEFAGDLPSAARRFIDPSRLTWVEESTLDRTTHQAPFTIRPDHYGSLLRCSGTFSLTAAGEAACVRGAEGELSVGIPLVGGKAERAIVSGLREHAELEAAALARWIDGR